MRAARFALALSTVAAFAQFPGQYPGQYPPGRSPIPGGRYPGGQNPAGGPRSKPQQAPGRTSTSKSAAAAAATTTDGILRRVSAHQLVIEGDDHRIIWYRLTDKTTVTKEGKDSDLKNFAVADRLSVDSSEDDQGHFTAAAVRWEKAGTAADRAAAAETWDLPKLGSTGPTPRASSAAAPSRDRDDDDRPILRRKNEAPAPAAQPQPPAPPAAAAQPSPAEQAAEEPVDTRPTTEVKSAEAAPDPDDPGRPQLRRGAPAPRRAASPVPAETAAPQAPGLPQASASSTQPAASSTGPILPQEDPLIQKAREVAASYGSSLPNFFCQQMTTRYETENIKQGWRAMDIVTADVAYEDGRESYKNIKVGNKAVNKSMDDIEGTRSTGEFATELAVLMQPGSGATFRRSGSDTIHGRTTVIFKFEVPRERSSWRIEQPSQLYYPAYRGSVWIDKDSARVLRIEQEARNMPSLFTLDTVETATDYDFVRLAASQEFLLPVDAEVLSCQRGTSFCARNRIEFRNYRKFGAESSVTFSDPQN